MDDPKKFGELSREEQNEMVRAHYVDDKSIEWYVPLGVASEWVWCECPNPLFYGTVIYRVKPEAPTPISLDWSVLKAEYKFAWKDGNGDAYASTTEPRHQKDRNEWIFGSYADANIVLIDHLASFDAGSVESKDSLIHRPENV